MVPSGRNEQDVAGDNGAGRASALCGCLHRQPQLGNGSRNAVRLPCRSRDRRGLESIMTTESTRGKFEVRFRPWVLAWIASAIAISTAAAQERRAPPLATGPDDRYKADLLVVVAHPDDESG